MRFYRYHLLPVTPMNLYEKRILNGECIVVIFKPEGVAYAKEKYPKLNLYSIQEIEAFEGLEVLEQKMLQEAKQIFGGAIFHDRGIIEVKQFAPFIDFLGEIIVCFQ